MSSFNLNKVFFHIYKYKLKIIFLPLCHEFTNNIWTISFNGYRYGGFQHFINISGSNNSPDLSEREGDDSKYLLHRISGWPDIRLYINIYIYFRGKFSFICRIIITF